MITTDLNPVPSRKSPETFSDYMDTFLSKLPDWSDEANDLADGCDANALTATTQAGIATTQAGIATTQAGIATTQAGIAEEFALTALNSPGTSATSATSLVIDSISQSITLEQTGKCFAVGQYVNIAKTSAPENAMFGKITSFNSGTGEMTVSVSVIEGSGTHTDWTVSLARSVLKQATTAEMEAATETELRSMSPADVGAAIVANGIQAGTISIFATSTVPAGYLECDGSSLSRATYSALFSIIGTGYGYVDGDHFNIPDYRGQFLRGWSHGQSVDPDRASRTNRGDGTTGDYVGTKQPGQQAAHTHGAQTPSITVINGTFTKVSGTGTPSTTGYKYESNLYSVGSQTVTASQAAHTHDSVGGNETRPTNINIMYCIKY